MADDKKKKKVTAQAKGRMAVAAKEQMAGAKRNTSNERAKAAWQTGGTFEKSHPATKRYTKALKHEIGKKK